MNKLECFHFLLLQIQISEMPGGIFIYLFIYLFIHLFTDLFIVPVIWKIEEKTIRVLRNCNMFYVDVSDKNTSMGLKLCKD